MPPEVWNYNDADINLHNYRLLKVRLKLHQLLMCGLSE
jgi:hypothetical protein